MIWLLFGDDNTIAWAEDELGHSLPRPAVGIGIVDGTEPIGAVVYHGYQGHMIEASIATTSPKWCQRHVLRALFWYPFRQLGVERFQAVTSKHNKRARRMLERLGFKYEGMARKGYVNGTDAAIYGMLRDECRWIGEGNG